MNEQEQKKIERLSKAGFTLIEIIIAVSIVGIMAAGAAVALPRMIKKAQTTSARETIGTAKTATMTYLSEHGKPPASQEKWVEALVGGDDPLIDGGEDALNDPWGNQLQYKLLKGNKFIITSWGPDGEENTEDDLTSDKDKEKK